MSLTLLVGLNLQKIFLYCAHLLIQTDLKTKKKFRRAWTFSPYAFLVTILKLSFSLQKTKAFIIKNLTIYFVLFRLP